MTTPRRKAQELKLAKPKDAVTFVFDHSTSLRKAFDALGNMVRHSRQNGYYVSDIMPKGRMTVDITFKKHDHAKG